MVNICVDSSSQLKTAISGVGQEWTDSKEYSATRKTGINKQQHKLWTDTTLKNGSLSNALRTAGSWNPKLSSKPNKECFLTTRPCKGYRSSARIPTHFLFIRKWCSTDPKEIGERGRPMECTWLDLKSGMRTI